jgi:hypothetical protein
VVIVTPVLAIISGLPPVLDGDASTWYRVIGGVLQTATGIIVSLYPWKRVRRWRRTGKYPR